MLADEDGRWLLVREDPYAAFNFEVDIGGVVVGFAEVIGLGCEIDYPETDEGRIASRVNDVIFRRGVTGDLSIWAWVRTVMSGERDARTVTVSLLDERRNPVCVWVLVGARPTKWSGPTFMAMGTEVAMEELVVSADGLEFTAPSSDEPGPVERQSQS